MEAIVAVWHYVSSHRFLGQLTAD